MCDEEKKRERREERREDAGGDKNSYGAVSESSEWNILFRAPSANRVA